MENKKASISIKKYDLNHKAFGEIIYEMKEDIEKIEEPTSEGKELLELFKSKYNIADETVSNKNFHKAMRGILKSQNNGLDFPLCPRPDKAIENWLKGSNPFAQSSGGYSPRQKIIAWMIYMKFSKEEINKFLNRYDYGELYIFDWFDLCALITYKFNKDFKYFWELQNRQEELFGKANHIILIQKDTPTPHAKIDFDYISSIDGNDKSLVWFINKHKFEFGRTHLSVYKWLLEMLSFSYSTTQNGIITNLIDEELKMIDEWIREHQEVITRNIREDIRDKTNTPIYYLYDPIKDIHDCEKALDKFCSSCDLQKDNTIIIHLKNIMEKNTDHDINLFKELIGKYHERIDFLKMLFEQYELSHDCSAYMKLISYLKDGPTKFDVEVSKYILNHRKEEAKQGLLELKNLIKDIDIQHSQLDDLNDRKISISRNFLILNILQNMSNKYLKEKFGIVIDNSKKTPHKKIVEIIIKNLNIEFSKFGFRKFNSSYRADQLLMIAIYNTNYEYLDIDQYPYRKFIEGVSQNRYLEFIQTFEEEQYYAY